MKKAATIKKKESWEGDMVVRFIPLEDLLPNPYQPASRGEVDPETIKKFALSIRQHGLIQTPVVRPRIEDSKYEIADGWLRRAGFVYLVQEAGFSEYAKMPCVLRDLTDQQMADMVLEANTIRKDLNPIDLARLYKQYLDDFKISQVELARRHNCSQGEVANTIRLLELPADIQESIISQEISETHGRQLLRLSYNPELQQKQLKECIKKGSSVNELSNSIAQLIYFNSENLEPEKYPRPPFDVAGCEDCPKRQKIGYPFSNEPKRWHCLDKACFTKKKEKAEQERIAKLTAEIEAAKAAAPHQEELPTKGKKGKKAEAGVIDVKNLDWHDYQELDREYHKVDDPGQCKTCPSRAIGLFHGDRSGPICINVKCFKEKEKRHEAKEAAKTRQREQELTDKVKALCDKPLDQLKVLKMVGAQLVVHCRRDTLEKFGKMYQLDDAFTYFASSTEGDTLQKLTALVLQKERYEGDKGMFAKMLADLEGTGGDIDKQIKDFQEKHCRTCEFGKGRCWTLMRVFLEKHCYRYSRRKKGKGVDENAKTATEKSSTEIEDQLPCKTCANAAGCDRSHFYSNDEGGYSCDEKKELEPSQIS